MRISKYIWLLGFFLPLFATVSCSDNGTTEQHRLLADSLCRRIYSEYYKNPRAVHAAAEELADISSVDGEGAAVAYNVLGYTAFMRMDYKESAALYSAVAATAPCEVERLWADVGLMTLCYRTSANREFFDYRTSAQRRMNRIAEEQALLSSKEQARLLRARVEFDIVSACYFANIGLEDERAEALTDLQSLLPEIKNLPLRIYARMMLSMRPTLTPVERAEILCTGLERAAANGFLWLSADYRLLLAIILRDDDTRNVLVQSIPAKIAELNRFSVPLNELPLCLALESADEFNMYGDRYMAIEALAVAASCNTQNGWYADALLLLDEALGYVNDYYSTFYSLPDTLPLFTTRYFDESAEAALLENDTIINIAECLLGIRREACTAYAGLGDKRSSDINRNSYLDLLRTTRLNKQMESRLDAASNNAQRMYVWFVVALTTLLAVAVAAWLLNVRWRHRNAVYTANLKQILGLCRRLMTQLPQELNDENEVYAAVENILNANLAKFSGDTCCRIVATEDGADGADGYTAFFPLRHVGYCRCEILRVASSVPLSDDKRALLEFALPYIAAALDEGRRIADIADEQLQLEQQRRSYNLYLAEHKRENVLKRVSLSVVNGMRPYMDRLLNELRHLARTRRRGSVEALRLQYIAELADKLDDYNAVLERWIKMRRGELNLQIENFAVAELFDIIRKGVQAFELRGVTLDVKDSFLVVKADKALTLFMVNTLADNACKFTPQGGRVTVEAVDGENFVEIAVSDTGVGLSAADVSRILNARVYDASQIGAGEKLSENKGGGFGLMNCKGIIEKYRKTDRLFSVCRFDIVSTQGRGSRFSFRLPKGALRVLTVCVALFSSLFAAADDTRFDRVNALADSVYRCNVDGRYSSAMLHARSAIEALNGVYAAIVGGDDTLSFSSGAAAELRWWRDALFADSLKEEVFYNLLDIRNEVAVAALALNDWNTYRYNNTVYASLYRLVHEDKGLLAHYEGMQRVANYRQAAVVLCVTLLLVLLIVYALLYVRHGIVERLNNRALLDINNRLLAVAAGERADRSSVARAMAAAVFDGMREIMRISRVSVLPSNGDGEFVAASVPTANDSVDIYLRRVCESGESFYAPSLLLYVHPLAVVSGGRRCLVGAIAVESARALSENEIIIFELVAGYAASAVYHSTVRLADKYRSLDSVQESMEQARMEENRLHVQNLVMDNCLSVIKHETVYYPGRIRELVAKLSADKIDDTMWHDNIAAMRELTDYYESVFAILSACAVRQLDNTGFRVSSIPMSDVWQHAEKYLKRRVGRMGLTMELRCEPTAAVANGDRDLVNFLFESLVDAALSFKSDGTLILRASEEGGFVKVELVDTRRRLLPDELSDIFVPSQAKIAGNSLVSMEYLVAKEIVRMHEDNIGRHGGRMEARNCDEGFMIFFTLPL